MLTTSQYEKKLEEMFGFASPLLMQEYADYRRSLRQGKRKAAERAEIAGNTPKQASPCATKVCRLGARECAEYRSCRDICRISDKRITDMNKCPTARE